MFKAEFLFSFPAETGKHQLRFEVEAMASRGDGRMRLTFSYGAVGKAMATMYTGWFENYTPWSESPDALLLRALWNMRNVWYFNLSGELHLDRIEAFELSVSGVDAGGETNVPLSKLTFALDPAWRDRRDLFVLSHMTADGIRTLDVRSLSAGPINAALAALLAIHTPAVDFDEHPAALELDVVTDRSGVRYVLHEQIPAYAREAFDAFRNRFRLASCGAIKSSTLALARDWELFIAA